MTKLAQDHRQAQDGAAAANESRPSFKPVALPALAAAVRATGQRTKQPRQHALPAILRKEAMTD